MITLLVTYCMILNSSMCRTLEVVPTDQCGRVYPRVHQGRGDG